MIAPSPFDTRILGLSVGKATVRGLTAGHVETLRGAMAAAGVELAFIRDEAPAFERLHELPWRGLELADVKVALVRGTAARLAPPATGYVVDFRAEARDVAGLQEIARAVARRSRFARCFSEAAAARLYDEWVANSLDGRAAHWFVVAREAPGAPPAGLVTVRIAGGAGDMAIVATADAHRGRGVLRLMTAAAIDRLAAEGVATCTVGTQLSNREAIGAYEALGFTFSAVAADFHLRRM